MRKEGGSESDWAVSSKIKLFDTLFFVYLSELLWETVVTYWGTGILSFKNL